MGFGEPSVTTALARTRLGSRADTLDSGKYKYVITSMPYTQIFMAVKIFLIET